MNQGHSAMPHLFSKMKKIIIIIFSKKKKKKIKISKNHASIRKVGAFGHASFIFKKKKRLPSSSFQKKKKFKISKNHTSISLGEFGHASSILKKRKSSFPQKSRFSKSCFNLQTRGIQLCLIQVRSPKSKPIR